MLRRLGEVVHSLREGESRRTSHIYPPVDNKRVLQPACRTTITIILAGRTQWFPWIPINNIQTCCTRYNEQVSSIPLVLSRVIFRS